ncbi:glycerate kinase [Brachybacterium endophyticum]|uniref:Glycerate kinase n=1 Tax=Brachybacterium endophyticum TaxID=2182385 RepID=A0A2U2RHC9_9MICO|nr:glycerate kinase [Brachybacterium endophyticum]PWH05231.1 glycerate kinase [Brachybacterium endophyticum]
MSTQQAQPTRPGPRTVLIAPDKFKGSLSAAEVAAAIARGIASEDPDVSTELLPIADGGDGTVEAALAAGFTAHTAQVTGPTGEKIAACWAQRGEDAVLELAETSGLRRLPGGELDHSRASTRGLGELIVAARDAGATRLLIGLGGSSSTDGGAGLLAALGARLLDEDDRPIPDGHDGLERLSSADLAPALATIEGLHLQAACDVTSPLLGPEGAAAVFGPQKGLDPGAIPAADRALRHVADHLDPDACLRERPGAGAAGGAGFALYALGADFASGADAVLGLLDFDGRLESANLVVTGEGKLDEQTLTGKGPAEVARRATAHGIPVLAVAGAVDIDAEQLAAAGIGRALDLVSRAHDVKDAIERAEELLIDAGREIGRSIREGTITAR